MPTKTSIEERALATLKRLEEKDRGLKQVLKKAYAYAVFPSVGKAALVVGGSYGRGAVFEKGKFIGHATISQFTVGVQIGGDTFSEVLIFENKQALDRLKKGKMAFAADASAVLVKAGAAAMKGFPFGVAAYAYSRGGMLLEAVIGGQKFTFKEASEEETADEQGEDQEQEQGQKSGKAKAGKGKGAAARSSQEDQADEEQDEGEGDAQDEGGEQEEEGQESGLLGRAFGGIRSGVGAAAGGVKSAASKVGETVKAHPIAATVVGGAVVLGVALMVTRAARAGSEQESDEGEEDNEAQGRGGEEGEEQDRDQDGDESEESEDTLNRLRRRRSSKA